MPIINRSLDASEQKESLKLALSPAVNGQEVYVPIERACTITDAKVSLIGISGSPNVKLTGLRFIAGTGGSSFAIGPTFAVTAFGTSGYLSYSLPATGASQLQLQKGDVVVLTQAGGTGAAAVSTVLDLVVQNIQDVKTWY